MSTLPVSQQSEARAESVTLDTDSFIVQLNDGRYFRFLMRGSRVS